MLKKGQWFIISRSNIAIFCGTIFISQLVNFYVIETGPYTLNRQFFFGLIGSNYQAIIVTLAGLLLLAYLSKKLPVPEGNYYFPLIFGGAFSNLLDRIWRGGVIDYIAFFHLPSFNAADLFIILGIALFCARLFLKEKIKTPF